MDLVEKERIEWIDIAKGIGLFLVILGHTHIPYLSTWIYTFHMPLFFFLSGFTFSGRKYNLKTFLVRRIKTLVIPYFSLGLVIYAFYVVINVIRGIPHELYGSNIEMLWCLIKQEHFWTIWFLTCLFIVEILYYWIDMISSNAFVSTALSSGLCILGLILYRLGCDGLPWNMDIALVAQFFFHVGNVLKRRKKCIAGIFKMNTRLYFVLAIVFLLINTVSGIMCIKTSGESLDMSIGMYGNELLTFISAFSGIMFILMLSYKIHSKFLNYLGRNTMIIFAWHSRIVIVLCGYIYNFFGIFQNDTLMEQCIYSCVTLLIVFIILIPINEMIKKSRFHAIFGV